MRRFIIFLSLVALTWAAPGKIAATASGTLQTSNAYSDSPVTLDLGNVGVNFGGFHASAGLGGLLTGDASKGGLHAEAGTPFGQEAGAGLGGTVDANGRSQGALFAGASAGGGVKAGAGIGGAVGVEGATYGHKTIHQSSEIVAEKTYSSPPKVVAEKTLQETPVVHRTVIEKTVIPQYVEKTIQVPTYVEKTIRVPTVVEHKVRVPVTPKVVERTYESDVTPTYTVHKRVRGPGLFKTFFANFGASGGAGAGASGGAVGGGSYGGTSGGSYGASIGVQKSGSLFDNIFAIPINTLGAVNGLLNNLAGGLQGSATISKRISYH